MSLLPPRLTEMEPTLASVRQTSVGLSVLALGDSLDSLATTSMSFLGSLLEGVDLKRMRVCQFYCEYPPIISETTNIYKSHAMG